MQNLGQAKSHVLQDSLDASLRSKAAAGDFGNLELQYRTNLVYMLVGCLRRASLIDLGGALSRCQRAGPYDTSFGSVCQIG